MEKCSDGQPFCNDIVLIEQDEKLRRSLSEVLNRYCKNLFSFESLKPALLHLKGRRLPSVIVTDLYLPDGTSTDLIRSCLRQSEVIVISNRASQEEAFMLGKMGVKSYLGKPVDTLLLASVISQSLGVNKADNKFTINTFGGLSILKNDREIKFHRKTPYKILEFIACVLALGAKNVPTYRISDYLWPDAEGDKAEKNLKTCLRRARDLLDPEDASVIVRESGRISLNSDKVLVDLWCLDKAPRGSAGRSMPYSREHFCQDWLPEYDRSWLIKPRAKYKVMAQGI
jgi:two-component SAPR family response regulator